MNKTPSPSYAWQHIHLALAETQPVPNMRKHPRHPAVTQNLGEPQTWPPQDIEEYAPICWLESPYDDDVHDTRDDFDAVATETTWTELLGFGTTRFDGAQTIDPSCHVLPQREPDVVLQQASNVMLKQNPTSIPPHLAKAELDLYDPWFLGEGEVLGMGMSPGTAFWAGVSISCCGFIVWCFVLFGLCP